jgi:hypothetical protein
MILQRVGIYVCRPLTPALSPDGGEGDRATASPALNFAYGWK